MAHALQFPLLMADKKNEPQSYGSQAEWVKGDVGQTVNRQNSEALPAKGDFYESRIGSEKSRDAEGGHVSVVQLAEGSQTGGPARDVDAQPTGGVATADGGAKRESFFRNRDYE
jgi:hypothetical protein